MRLISRDSISTKLLSFFLPMICIGLIVVFAIFEFRNYRTQIDTLLENLELFTSTQALALASPVWHLDTNSLEILVQVMAKNPDVLTIRVTDPDGNLISEAASQTKVSMYQSLREERPIIFANREVTQEVGRLIVNFHTTRVWEIVRQRLIVDAVVLAILCGMLIATTVFLTGKFISNPIGKLHKSIQRMKLENVREPVDWTSSDELGEVVNAYNEMQAQQIQVERRTRDFAEASSDWFWEMDADLRYTYLSDRFEEITGLPIAQKLGTHRWDFADPQESPEKWVSHKADLEARRPFKDFEYDPIVNGKRVIHISVSGNPIYNLDGQFMGYRGSTTNITGRKNAEIASERKAAEEETLGSLLRLSLAVSSMEDYLKDCIEGLLASVPWLNLLPSGGIFLVKPEEEEDELRLVAHQNLAPQLLTLCDRVPFGKCHCGRAAAEREIQYSDCVDERHETQFDGIKPHGHYNVPILADNKVLGVIVLYLPHGHPKEASSLVFLDRVATVLSMGISMRLNKDSLTKAREEAESANLAKSEFLAHMSHELRTPLNSIIGYSQMIGGEELGELSNPKYLEYANDISFSGQHLLGVISDILDLSKIEAQEIEIEETEIDIRKFVESSLGFVQLQGDSKDQKLDVSIASAMPGLRADGRLVQQILINLLTNAVKFTPEGGNVTVTACLDDQGGVVLGVVDTGVGIAPEDLKEALEPFGQVRRNPEISFEGTGLGLSLSKRLTELHGGRLSIKSQVGKGTTVNVEFPPERTLRS